MTGWETHDIRQILRVMGWKVYALPDGTWKVIDPLGQVTLAADETHAWELAWQLARGEIISKEAVILKRLRDEEDDT